MKDLEVMMINTISSAFETISTVEQGVELLDIFMHLQVREVRVSGTVFHSSSIVILGGNLSHCLTLSQEVTFCHLYM